MKSVINATEDEYHFLFGCSTLQSVRSLFYVKVIDDIEQFMLIPDGEKVRLLMREVGFREMGDIMIDMFNKRREVLYKPNLG